MLNVRDNATACLIVGLFFITGSIGAFLKFDEMHARATKFSSRGFEVAYDTYGDGAQLFLVITIGLGVIAACLLLAAVVYFRLWRRQQRLLPPKHKRYSRYA